MSICRLAPKIIEFLSYYPLKQGLKLVHFNVHQYIYQCIFILLSIKTRIET